MMGQILIVTGFLGVVVLVIVLILAQAKRNADLNQRIIKVAQSNGNMEGTLRQIHQSSTDEDSRLMAEVAVEKNQNSIRELFN